MLDRDDGKAESCRSSKQENSSSLNDATSTLAPKLSSISHRGSPPGIANDTILSGGSRNHMTQMASTNTTRGEHERTSIKESQKTVGIQSGFSYKYGQVASTNNLDTGSDGKKSVFSGSDSDCIDDVNCFGVVINDDFVLPPADDSSLESSEDEYHNEQEKSAIHYLPKTRIDSREEMAVMKSESHKDVPCSHAYIIVNDDTFCLPSPESSSDDESMSDCNLLEVITRLRTTSNRSPVPQACSTDDQSSSTLSPVAEPSSEKKKQLQYLAQQYNKVPVEVVGSRKDRPPISLTLRKENGGTFNPLFCADPLEPMPQFGVSENSCQPDYYHSSQPCCGDYDGSPDNPQPRRLKPPKRVFAVDDTPESQDCQPGSDLLGGMIRRTGGSETYLSNTQAELDILCAVCGNGESPDEDPIILCDGPGSGMNCCVAVHATCYSITVDITSDEEWRCEPCEFRFHGGEGTIKCEICGNSSGALKLQEKDTWKHVRCPAKNKVCMKLKKLKRRRLNSRVSTNNSSITSHSLVSRKSSPAIIAQEKRRQHYFKHFIDDEAGIKSDDDIDGDESEEQDVKAIEEEEALMGNFINDSSQLGYSPDSLDNIDPGSAIKSPSIFRRLDVERERALQFATPLLNRRMITEKQDDPLLLDTDSTPDSEKGLGNMHFIRSVLEHHRNGGDADDIEEVYDTLAAKEEVALDSSQDYDAWNS